MMRAVPPPAEAEPPSLASVLEGLRHARSRPELMATYIVDIVAMFFGMPMALFPAEATHLGGASVLGLLYAAPAVGSLVATVTSGWVAHADRQGAGVCRSATRPGRCWKRRVRRVASLAGVRVSIVSGGVLCVAGVIVAAFALPMFWRYDSRTESPV